MAKWNLFVLYNEQKSKMRKIRNLPRERLIIQRFVPMISALALAPIITTSALALISALTPQLTCSSRHNCVAIAPRQVLSRRDKRDRVHRGASKSRSHRNKRDRKDF